MGELFSYKTLVHACAGITKIMCVNDDQLCAKDVLEAAQRPV